MQPDQLNEIVGDIKLPVSDPLFSTRVFTVVCRERKALSAKDGDNIKRVCAEEYDDLSKRLDRSKIQESCSVRNVLKTRRLANLLITDKGELNGTVLNKAIAFFSEFLYSLGPNRQYDSIRQEYILKVLKDLQTKKELIFQFKKISRPYANKHAEQIIRETLQLPDNTIITDAHTKRAVLSALLCYLRQNVGSCFATAPAIVIHDEYPEQFLKDIEEILGTGRLKRTYAGVEYSVPLSTSWGAGDLKKLFFLPKDDSFENTYIWQSPGLMAAFETIGYFDSETDLKDKVEACKQIILNLREHWNSHYPSILTSAEEIIRRALLSRLQITEQDLTDFQNRPRNLIQSSLLMQMPKAAFKSGGKGEACTNFIIILDKAQNAFKSLADNALLKAWEFTLASFSENKSGFTRWNLYSSLGLASNQKGGIGFCLYEILKRKLDDSNERVNAMQREYEAVYSQLKILETRFRSASSEKDAQWMKMDYQSKLNEFNALEDVRNKFHYKSRRYANLFDTLVGIYDELFPRYFQEVYDADMHDVASGPYDDSPAGFRLIYKHGRSNTSQWTPIYNPNDFVENLANFFTATESEVASDEEIKGLEVDLSEIITALVRHIRSPEFIETAFYRMAEAHNGKIIKNPLENLDKIEKKPWAYTSGGTMDTLVSCYFRREQKPTEVGRWVESPTELLVFLIDTLKQIPPKVSDDFLKNPNKSMLIHSPTHAFILKPGTSPFKEAWQNDLFTYTWVRDQIIKPMEDFVDRMYLSEGMQEYLIGQLELLVNPNFQHYFRKIFLPVHGNENPVHFRDNLVDRIDRERGLQYQGQGVLSSDDIDSYLYSALPVFPVEQLKTKVEAIFSRLPQIEQKIWETLPSALESIMEVRNENYYISAKQLQEISKALLAMITLNTSIPINYDKAIAEAAQDLRFAMPKPIMVADTNWVKDNFAFLVNPGTGRLEFWRVDPLGIVGYPMTIWANWLNGSRRDRTWGVYTRPYEYSR